MSSRHLDRLLRPRSIALIGGGDEARSRIVARNLMGSGFKGPLRAIGGPGALGMERAASLGDLPAPPDLVVIDAPADHLTGIVDDCGRAGAGAAVIVSSGPGHRANALGARLSADLVAAARPHGLRLIGPDSLGVMVPGLGVNASVSPVAPQAGRIALVAQSGTIVTSVLSWADDRRAGFSHVLSLGDMADVHFGDLLDYLANDVTATSIFLYIETITDARSFMSAGRAAARTKPVLVVKAGRHEAGREALVSHSGALAAPDEVFDAAFRRAGMLRARSLEELFDVAGTLARAALPAGDRLAILTNSGGMGVLTTDTLVDVGGRLARFAPETLAALGDVLPPTRTTGNPVDLGPAADGDEYVRAFETLAADRDVDAILVINCPTAMASRRRAAEEIARVAKGRRRPVILTSWVGEAAADLSRRVLVEAGIATYATPGQGVRAFTHLLGYRRSQTLLMETPPSVPESFEPDLPRARAAIDGALADGRRWLSATEGAELMAAYGIPGVSARLAPTPEAAARLAAELGVAVALKIVSPDIIHKAEVKGIALDLAGPAAVLEAARSMAAHIERVRPTAKIEGFMVQPMIRRPEAYELIVGAVTDRRFGPVVVFGHGGTAVEVIADKALGLPPLNMHLAREIMARTRVWRLLRGDHGRPAVDVDGVALTLIKVAQLVADFGEIAELDINPLLADSYGVLALDVRVAVTPYDGSSTDRLAIRPYPKALEETIPTGDGRDFLLRPVVPEDEPSLQRTFAQLSEEEIRLRFFAPIKALSHVMAARFTQLDYDRELALIVTEHGIPGRTPLYGLVSLSCSADRQSAEYALLVRGDMTGLGFGPVLMRRIIDHARSYGVREVVGDVLRENKSMLKLCQVLGFRASADDEDPGLMRVRLAL